MFDDPALLVVDDEEVICQGCERIFSSRGYRVETSIDPRHGLHLAASRDYAAILLDLKMPSMDGLQFLEALRKNRPDTPVILITGYPSIPNAAGAMRLGASDYVTKPFTPDEITAAVERTLASRRPATPEIEPEPAPAWTDAWRPAGPFVFRDEAWAQPGTDGTFRLGSVLTRAAATGLEAVRMPQVHEKVYQGLPLAECRLDDGRRITIPAPLSGTVLAINARIVENPACLWESPCRDGWIAVIEPDEDPAEIAACTPRRVIVANRDPAGAAIQRDALARLGADVRWMDAEELLIAADDDAVVLFDAASHAEAGPDFARRITAARERARIIVVASPGARWETAYRAQRIFYYAVEPFADGEIADILDAAFRRRPAAPVVMPDPDGRPVRRISIRNRRGRRVDLLAAGGLLQGRHGLGALLRHKLMGRLYPIETTIGASDVTPADILRTAETCDRLFVLMPRDTGRVAGSLLHDSQNAYLALPESAADTVTTLVVQPDVGEIDRRITEALAERIVQAMSA